MRYLSGLFLVLLFSSCEGYFNLKGKVLSSSSGKPVDDARFTLIVNEKDTVRLHCSIIERDSITPKEKEYNYGRKIQLISLRSGIKQVFINTATHSYIRTEALMLPANYLM
ncbi:hypothetical protein LWM68_26675 [Niabella sp. W65]|nr:hypothetical protein [Niabella sp. W65]MCH7366039.1 hypothetical protein [Niabella sp. W65]